MVDMTTTTTTDDDTTINLDRKKEIFFLLFEKTADNDHSEEELSLQPDGTFFMTKDRTFLESYLKKNNFSQRLFNGCSSL